MNNIHYCQQQQKINFWREIIFLIYLMLVHFVLVYMLYSLLWYFSLFYELGLATSCCSGNVVLCKEAHK